MKKNTKREAIYPGTFDPITNGHLDIVRRASRLYDRVVVAVANNVNKNSFFTQEERIALAIKVLKKFPNVEVLGFNCLLTELAQKLKIHVIVRGLRAVSDFEYEFQLAMMNRSVKPDFETIFLTPSEEYMFISSSLAREVAHYHGDVSRFVPTEVVQALRKKLNY
ncbi:MAG: pantetheine-phosphate adenylyltransferase [Gammaproteobacteria bacterium]|jgi:pantetheine-phosphate adenylyltransferase|nr:pantetheine-phosphate adenylyltransferase [Gammaproteobacteria bacterium]